MELFPHRPILGHQLEVLQSNPVLTPSTWNSRQTPQVKGSGSQDCSSILQTPVVSPCCHLCSSPTSSTSEVPTTPLLRFDNFLEEVIELRKTIYFLDYQIIIKDTGQGHTDGRHVEGRVCGRGTQLPCPL